MRFKESVGVAEFWYHDTLLCLAFGDGLSINSDRVCWAIIAVNPIVLSMLRPPFNAHIEAPLPRWTTIARPLAISGATCGKVFAIYSYERP